MNLKTTLTLTALVLGLAAVPAAYADESAPAPVAEVETEGSGIDNYELGCWFNAGNPYLAQDGKIYTKIQIRCDTDKWLYWDARLTKVVNNGVDQTVGSLSGRDLFDAGKMVTFYLSNNRDSCPGSGYFFGKISIREKLCCTSYSDRSASIYIRHC